MMGFQGQYYRVFPRFNRPYQSEIFGHKSATSIAAARVTDFTPILASFHQRDKMPYQIAVTMAMIGIEDEDQWCCGGGACSIDRCARVTHLTTVLASFHQRDKMLYQIAVTMATIGIEDEDQWCFGGGGACSKPR